MSATSSGLAATSSSNGKISSSSFARPAPPASTSRRGATTGSSRPSSTSSPSPFWPAWPQKRALRTGVLLTPLLNPVQVAEDVATLDHICQGRFIFGIGLGYRAEEFEAAGITSSERVDRFEEGLAR
jgi:Luciferase-like monooxygenase